MYIYCLPSNCLDEKEDLVFSQISFHFTYTQVLHFFTHHSLHSSSSIHSLCDDLHLIQTIDLICILLIVFDVLIDRIHGCNIFLSLSLLSPTHTLMIVKLTFWHFLTLFCPYVDLWFLNKLFQTNCLQLCPWPGIHTNTPFVFVCDRTHFCPGQVDPCIYRIVIWFQLDHLPVSISLCISLSVWMHTFIK